MISRLVMHILNHYYISTEGNFVIRQLARGSIRTPMCLLDFVTIGTHTQITYFTVY